MSRDLLVEWNAGFQLTATHVSPLALLKGWAGYRLGEPSGRVGDFVRDVGGFAADEPTYIDYGEWFPNPLAFARGVVDLPSSCLLRAVVGNVHGDLHGNNVLVSTRPPIRSTYYLIDFDTYRPDAHLFYDHAYFELAHLLRRRAQGDPLLWKSLLDALSRFSHPMADAHLSSDDHGHVELVTAIRREVTDWVDRTVPHRLPDLDAQYLLARVAVGLVWSHRRLPEALRRNAFTYAAANLRDYLNLTGIAWPKWGPPLGRSGTRAASTPAPQDDGAQPATNTATSTPAPAGAGVADADRPTADSTAFEVYRARPMVAVLPFENRSGDPDQEYVADAITDELLIELSKIDWLMPVSRSNSYEYKGGKATAATVGTELGVPYVVEGSVRRRGDVLRITAVLEETERGARIWGDRFDIQLDQLYDAEDEMVTMIVAHVESKLKGSEQDRARRKPPEDLDAWDLTQRAQWHLLRRAPDDDAQAEQYAKQAIARDADYSTPHALLAVLYCRVVDPYRGPLEPDDVARALQHARTAVRLDPSEGYAHGALGQALLASGEPALALAEFQQYVELNPSSSPARLWVAEALIILGRLHEALHAIEVSIALSPLEAYVGWEYLCKGFCEYGLGDYAAAEDSFERSRRHPPAAALATLALGATLAELGRGDDARRALAQAMELAGPGGFASVRQFAASARGRLVSDLRDGLIAAGMPPELWPAPTPDDAEVASSPVPGSG